MPTNFEKSIDWGSALDTSDTFVFYHFYEAGETTPFEYDPQLVFSETSSGWSNNEKQAFRKALDVYELFLNLHFHETDQAGDADINLVSGSIGSFLLGAMFPPGEGPRSGFGYFNKNGSGWTSNGLEQGGFGFVTIIHELGHGFGLAHPHDRGGTSIKLAGVGSSSDYGKHDLNQGIYTTMSYNDGWQTNPDGSPPLYGSYGYQGTPMAVDIAVLQAKYGANNAYHTGNNTYDLPTSNGTGTFYSCIWDAGGTDTIRFDGNSPAVIDLRPASLKVKPGGGGYLSYADGIFGGFTIANGVRIENATGGSGKDLLRGNGADNQLIGRGDDDLLRGARGDDRLVGRNGEDRFKGGRGADLLKGGKKTDMLDGGKGNDTLKGNAGIDHYVFTAKPGRGVDTITKFQAGETIMLDDKAFDGISNNNAGTLRGKFFTSGAHAKDGNDYIICNKNTGKLFYDPDGDGSANKILFARFDPGDDIHRGDLIVI